MNFKKHNFGSDTLGRIYVERGSEVGVLLVHSYTSTPYEFIDLIDYLTSRNITVLAPRIAGHGTTPQDLALSTINDWKNSVLNSFLFLRPRVKKIFIIGSSFGGNLTFDLAATTGEKIDGIISLGTPIRLRWQRLFKLALYTYGWFKKNQKKRRHHFKSEYMEQEQIIYTVMPIPSLRRFFKFISQYTIPILNSVIVPTLIIQSSDDRIVDPLSAFYLHEHLGSDDKRILWVNSRHHTLATDDKRWLIYRSILRFINSFE
ncbi:MAG: alpha/beta fold hydrolase [Patescibacteria group bacterium]|nr:alpha/beta fold hydrolase [Patescibacteria group bacterium]